MADTNPCRLTLVVTVMKFILCEEWNNDVWKLRKQLYCKVGESGQRPDTTNTRNPHWRLFRCYGRPAMPTPLRRSSIILVKIIHTYIYSVTIQKIFQTGMIFIHIHNEFLYRNPNNKLQYVVQHYGNVQAMHISVAVTMSVRAAMPSTLLRLP